MEHSHLIILILLHFGGGQREIVTEAKRAWGGCE
jgi:hypothetical protein